MSSSYRIMRTDGEPDWEKIPALSAGHILWEPDCGVRAEGRFCHDGQNLYVRLQAKEKDIRAEYTEPLSPVHEDSCLEFFFMPEKEDRYLNFEINPNGCLHTGFGRDRHDRVRLAPDEPAKLFGIRTERTPDGWEAEYRIPLSFLRLFYPDFSFSGKLMANVYKCGDKTKHAHFLAWEKVGSETPDFHRKKDFGEMIFG